MKELLIQILNWCPCVGASLYSLHVPSGLGERAESDVSMSHVFSQFVLAAITLVGGEAAGEGARARARCELDTPFCSVTYTTILVVWAIPKLLE